MRHYKFLSIHDDSRSYIINIQQIVWFDANSQTLVMTAPRDAKGIFHLDKESTDALIKEMGKENLNASNMQPSELATKFHYEEGNLKGVRWEE